MSFTDADLKRLREAENALQRSFGIPALLARLEAAETIVDACRIYHGDALKFKPELWGAWRKAAGK